MSAPQPLCRAGRLLRVMGEELLRNDELHADLEIVLGLHLRTIRGVDILRPVGILIVAP